LTHYRRIHPHGGDDVIRGGTGNDYLTGQYGNDQYLFAPGDGSDLIEEFTGTDRLTFEGGIDPAELWFSQEETNLVISRLGTTDSVTIAGWFTPTYGEVLFQVEDIEAADGTSVLRAGDVNSLISQIAAFSAQVGSDPSAVQPSDLPPEYQVAVNSIWQAS
jgi:hypothetical protein